MYLEAGVTATVTDTVKFTVTVSLCSATNRYQRHNPLVRHRLLTVSRVLEEGMQTVVRERERRTTLIRTSIAAVFLWCERGPILLSQCTVAAFPKIMPLRVSYDYWEKRIETEWVQSTKSHPDAL